MAASERAAEPHYRPAFLLAYHGGITDGLIRKAVATAGLSPRHVATLQLLADGPVSQKALIEGLGVDPSVLVALLNGLEKDELVERRRDPADRRRHIVEITPEGTARLRKADAALDMVERELFADLSERELATLRGLLDRLRTSAGSFECGE
ncbi:MarR family winged helix-turn-helix transcriptional regulator [Streptomyces indicus]|uniref:DNA-binding transcriptional regulator, MarR family n=1 Tax=Streptomyces indicus TaxID=417292 RepID=A0A1G8WC95_9ACTN|nr:MarR family winged helix-turn-helix transcriptional regulator [Streptomyces indicus]SDJ75757.1 DNA-binding transcriptional regulator, MarR family [Streptomyces indicus]